MGTWAAVFAGAVAVVFGGVMLLHRSLYVCAISLLVVLLQTAVLFFLCGAPLLGFLQVMIYAGAVMVLVVITVMATGGHAGTPQRFAHFRFPRPLAWLGLAAAAGELGLALARGGTAAAGTPAAGLQAAFGPALFKPYAAATEAVTLLMFLAALAIAPGKEPA